jgi:hypothetical protein
VRERAKPLGLDALALPSLRDVVTPLVRIVEFVRQVLFGRLLCLTRVALAKIQSVVYFVGLLRPVLLSWLAHRNSLVASVNAPGVSPGNEQANEQPSSNHVARSDRL